MTGLRVENLSKSFGGVPILRGVDLEFAPGTVNVLAGENGAGKSTLMKIVAGLLRPDGGRVAVGGRELSRFDPVHARNLGVSFIPQELAPLPDMRVDENLMLGRVSRTAFGLVDRAAMARQARELLARFDVGIDPRTPMRRLSVAMTQLVEIAKHTGWDSTVMLMDEPTAAIAEREIERLFTVIQRLRDRGVCIVYTTHKMAEIEAIADTVSVLRDGKLVTSGEAAGFTQQSVVSAMIGRPMGELFPERPPRPSKPPVLSVDLTVQGTREPVSLQVRPGEIVGLAGLVGAGRSELLEAIFGVHRASGTVSVAGRKIRLGVPNAAIAGGMAFVPEDRKNAGLVLEMSVADNTILPYLRRFLAAGMFVDRGARAKAVAEVSDRVDLHGRPAQRVRQLSGGNQQKVVLSRWLLGNMKVLLLDEPTRGVDVGARAEIYRIVTQLASAGVAVLLASSEMDEVVNLSHRVLVMRGRGIVAELMAENHSDAELKTEVLHHAMGLARSA
ncbi:MAG TPA: sugar ABC transporter ATP-binding protein [Amycolatopsis sp.]|nr:sugar ABC transporter ATP-binding protein [Amycolatopsis sp.]